MHRRLFCDGIGRFGDCEWWLSVFTIEDTATYSITVYGAKGGSTYFDGGDGAMMTGEFSLTAGQELKILVGQMGVNGDMGTTGSNGGGGGGGTFVALSDNTH